MGHVAKVVLLRREHSAAGWGAGSFGMHCFLVQFGIADPAVSVYQPGFADRRCRPARITATKPTPACPVANPNTPTISAMTPTATPYQAGRAGAVL